MLETFLRYQETAQAFLGLTSSIVAVGVVQTAVLRRALLGSGVVEEKDYPADFVLVYGAVFALAVAILYLPTIVTLRETGHALRDSAMNHGPVATSDQPTREIDRWLDFQDRRHRLNKALGLDLSVVARIQLTLGLLAPFLVSLLTTVLLPT